MKILNKEQTVNHLLNEYNSGKRIALTRYGDGEYLMMNGSINRILMERESKDVLPDLLLRTISTKGHLLCIPQPKDHNIKNDDIWFKAHKFIIENSQCELYGHANWNVYDFINGSNLISNFFYSKTLLITPYIDEAKRFFDGFNNVEYLYAPEFNASLKYEELKESIFSIFHLFKNILFSMGPIGKVIISDLINEPMSSNLIDFGSLINAILRLESKWTMSWTKNIDLNKHIAIFKEKILELNK